MRLDQKRLRDDLSKNLQTESRFYSLLRSNPEDFHSMAKALRWRFSRGTSATSTC